MSLHLPCGRGDMRPEARLRSGRPSWYSRAGLEIMDMPYGLAPRALRDIQAGQAVGQFAILNAEIALSAGWDRRTGIGRLRESPARLAEQFSFAKPEGRLRDDSIDEGLCLTDCVSEAGPSSIWRGEVRTVLRLVGVSDTSELRRIARQFRGWPHGLQPDRGWPPRGRLASVGAVRKPVIHSPIPTTMCIEVQIPVTAVSR